MRDPIKNQQIKNLLGKKQIERLQYVSIMCRSLLPARAEGLWFSLK